MHDTASAPRVKGAICSSSYSFNLPESFDPREFLKDPRDSVLWDDARYFLSLILTKFARRQVDRLGAVRLRAEFLRSIMHFRSYRRVIDALLAGGAVERLPYAPGQRPFGYKLAKRYIRDKHVRVPVACPRLDARLKGFHESDAAQRRGRMKPIHRRLEKLQHGLRIDGDLAREILKGMPECNPWDCQGLLVADIEQRQFRFNVGRYGRISNSISNLKKAVRAAIFFGREPLPGVDIVSAQPALLAVR